jgi:hypothetical protein
MPLSRFSGHSDPRKLLISFEVMNLSARGDDSVLVKSFIIVPDDAVTQWYSVLSPGTIHCWEDLKQRILSNFQGFQCPQLIENDFFLLQEKREGTTPKLL